MLFISVLFNLSLFGDFPAICLSLISSLILVLSVNRHCMISVCFFNLLKCVLWPKIWSILVSVPCELAENVLLGEPIYQCQLDPAG